MPAFFARALSATIFSPMWRAYRATGSPSGHSRSLMTSISKSAAGADSPVPPVSAPSWPFGMGVGLLVKRDRLPDRGQPAGGRAVERLPARAEPRPVQRAVPGAHRRVPVDHTAEVGASGRALVG